MFDENPNNFKRMKQAKVNRELGNKELFDYPQELQLSIYLHLWELNKS